MRPDREPRPGSTPGLAVVSRTKPVPVAGIVQDIRKIEGADLIRVATVYLGPDKPPAEIVFGGKDVVEVGHLVPVAPPGSWVPGPAGVRRKPVKMRHRRYRGQNSQGMLCSLIELGWAKDRDQVALLQNMKPGDPLPAPTEWRGVVASPDPADFGPNTEELSLSELRGEYDTGPVAPQSVQPVSGQRVPPSVDASWLQEVGLPSR
jgi:tRNA-binding EMAP/Myf-like protein